MIEDEEVIASAVAARLRAEGFAVEVAGDGRAGMELCARVRPDLVVLASALSRLGLYEAAYGFTRLRLAAHVAILWLGAVFVLVIAAGLARRAGWLPRAVVALSGLTRLGFALSNPDGRIATRNGERYVRTGDADTSVLSADATPAIVALPREISGCIGARLDRPDGVVGANLSRSRARTALSSRSGWPSDCTPR